MESILRYIQIGLSIILAALILIQQTDASLGAAFGGSGGDSIERSRRGLERTLFQITIVIAILFAISVLASLLIS
mgnify:CR=1 FL=1